jgi:hypothetical protein
MKTEEKIALHLAQANAKLDKSHMAAASGRIEAELTGKALVYRKENPLLADGEKIEKYLRGVGEETLKSEQERIDWRGVNSSGLTDLIGNLVKRNTYTHLAEGISKQHANNNAEFFDRKKIEARVEFPEAYEKAEDKTAFVGQWMTQNGIAYDLQKNESDVKDHLQSNRNKAEVGSVVATGVLNAYTDQNVSAVSAVESQSDLMGRGDGNSFFSKMDETMRKQVEAGNLNQGDYDTWREGMITQNKRIIDSKIDRVTELISSASNLNHLILRGSHMPEIGPDDLAMMSLTPNASPGKMHKMNIAKNQYATALAMRAAGYDKLATGPNFYERSVDAQTAQRNMFDFLIKKRDPSKNISISGTGFSSTEAKDGSTAKPPEGFDSVKINFAEWKEAMDAMPADWYFAYDEAESFLSGTLDDDQIKELSQEIKDNGEDIVKHMKATGDWDPRVLTFMSRWGSQNVALNASKALGQPVHDAMRAQVRENLIGIMHDISVGGELFEKERDSNGELVMVPTMDQMYVARLLATKLAAAQHHGISMNEVTEDQLKQFDELEHWMSESVNPIDFMKEMGNITTAASFGELSPANAKAQSEMTGAIRDWTGSADIPGSERNLINQARNFSLRFDYIKNSPNKVPGDSVYPLTQEEVKLISDKYKKEISTGNTDEANRTLSIFTQMGEDSGDENLKQMGKMALAQIAELTRKDIDSPLNYEKDMPSAVAIAFSDSVSGTGSPQEVAMMSVLHGKEIRKSRSQLVHNVNKADGSEKTEEEMLASIREAMEDNDDFLNAKDVLGRTLMREDWGSDETRKPVNEYLVNAILAYKSLTTEDQGTHKPATYRDAVSAIANYFGRENKIIRASDDGLGKDIVFHSGHMTLLPEAVGSFFPETRLKLRSHSDTGERRRTIPSHTLTPTPIIEGERSIDYDKEIIPGTGITRRILESRGTGNGKLAVVSPDSRATAEKKYVNSMSITALGVESFHSMDVFEMSQLIQEGVIINLAPDGDGPMTKLSVDLLDENGEVDLALLKHAREYAFDIYGIEMPSRQTSLEGKPRIKNFLEGHSPFRGPIQLGKRRNPVGHDTLKSDYDARRKYIKNSAISTGGIILPTFSKSISHSSRLKHLTKDVTPQRIKEDEYRKAVVETIIDYMALIDEALENPKETGRGVGPDNVWSTYSFGTAGRQKKIRDPKTRKLIPQPVPPMQLKMRKDGEYRNYNMEMWNDSAINYRKDD